LLGPVEGDLAFRAAHALRATSGTRHGVTLNVSKRIPAGSGMGGGSSDAATTLIALNRLWALQLPRAALAKLALELGADVPFFLHGASAFAHGIGEQLHTVSMPAAWYAIVWPHVRVPTHEIFADTGLTRNTEPTKISDFSAAAEHFPQAQKLFGANDLEPVARRQYPQIDDALRRLSRFGCARMTGSGAAVFLATTSEASAHAAVAKMPSHWSRWVVRGLSEHPLAEW
jgi:4-diphosphocytidyl-2-C-methyl-D-erythritol kinase